MIGTDWNCSIGGKTCTRDDPLSAGSAYPPITVTVNVSQTAADQVTNQVSVAGGGSATVTASDPTAILSACGVNQDGSTTVTDVQNIINEALGMAPAVHDLNGDGVVNVLDVQRVINAALGLGCPGS